jgi:hypothetical protein
VNESFTAQLTEIIGGVPRVVGSEGRGADLADFVREVFDGEATWFGGESDHSFDKGPNPGFGDVNARDRSCTHTESVLPQLERDFNGI